MYPATRADFSVMSHHGARSKSFICTLQVIALHAFGPPEAGGADQYLPLGPPEAGGPDQYLIQVSPLEGIKPLLGLSFGIFLSPERLARPILNRKVLPNSCIKSIRSITELKQNQSTFNPS